MTLVVPTTVIGYHGTTAAAAEAIVGGEIVRSAQSYDWLGHGFYVWQDSPWRAGEWAEAKFGADAAVVAVEVDLTGCLDLFNPAYQRQLADADAQMVIEMLAGGVAPPLNRGGRRDRDCATINWFCDAAAADGIMFRSVRAIFEEGDPIFDESAINARSHVQIAVRDVACILQAEEVQL